MRNLFRLLGIIAVVAIIGFGVVACNGGDPPDNRNDPTVTWPADGSLYASVGQTLSQVPIPAHTGTTLGAFSWTNPDADVGAEGSRSHNMTFTPTEIYTHKTVNKNVVITVGPASPFIFDATTGTITGYTGAGGAVTIPSQINGVAVTAIGLEAFVDTTNPFQWEGKGLTSVTLPEGIITIEESAFRHNLLTSVNIPNSVTTIGVLAFYDCGLTSVTFGNSLQTIGTNAFSENNLTTVVFPNSLQVIGSLAFEGQLTEVTIGADVDIQKSGGGRQYDGIPYLTNYYYQGAGTYTRTSTSDTHWSFTALP